MSRLLLILALLTLVCGCALFEPLPPLYPGATVTDSGLQYIDNVIGSGPQPAPGQRVTVHYTGTFADGRKFDSSHDRDQPFTFVIGQRRVIPGWDEGVMTMKVGGQRKLIIPPELAYGEQGVPGRIPPFATLLFEVELLNIQP